jgi:formamidopyrimidine-DNA glycosylase
MPELPEVESFVRALNQGRNLGAGSGDPGGFPSIAGSRILRLRCDFPKCLQPSPAAVRRALTGARIDKLFRRGKNLAFALERGCFAIHLRMSGRLIVLPRGAPKPPYAHLSIALDSGWVIHLDDARKFGRLRFMEDFSELDSELGVEPLSRGFDAACLARILEKRKRAVKPLLLDQSLIAGIGNIYADESLWRARIHPLRPASSLSPAEVADLVKAVRDSLRAGIKKGGAAIDWVYPGGRFQEEFSAYGRKGLPCPRCGAEIRRAVVAQRGTHFCPRCQKP